MTSVLEKILPPAQYTASPMWKSYAGPRSAVRVLFVGEAWGESEDRARAPFVGWSGKELFKTILQAAEDEGPEAQSIVKSFNYGDQWLDRRRPWLEREGVAFTNVLAFRPPENKIERIAVAKVDRGEDYPSELGPITKIGAKQLFLEAQYLGELARLASEIDAVQPNLIVALGNTACWALLGTTGIGRIRGAVAETQSIGTTRLSRHYKVLPTYHPAGVLRQWSFRPVWLADLIKAWREKDYPEIRRPKRWILVSPTIWEVERWTENTLSFGTPLLSADIETAKRQITMISFARSASNAITIPFAKTKEGLGNYWADPRDEVRAWRCVERLLGTCPMLGQNFMYDMQYLAMLRLHPRKGVDDTMLRHHSLFPEMEKGLGFLGSIYTQEASWKLMRHRKGSEVVKKDE